MKKVLFEDWHYEYSVFPYEIVWALVTIFDDKSSNILDCRGVIYNFETELDRQIWLNSEEYTALYQHEDLEDDIDRFIYPILKKHIPKGNTRNDLVKQMIVTLPKDVIEGYFKIIGINNQ